MAGLSDLQVRLAKPLPRDVLLGDGNNLFLRIRPSGSKTWVVRIERAGKWRVHTLGRFPAMSVKEARAEAAKIVLTERGEARIPVSEAVESFMDAQIRPRYRRVNNAEVYARRLTIALGAKTGVDAVRGVDVSRWISSYRTEAPIAAMRAFAFAKQFFGWCVSVGYMDRSPVGDMRSRAFGVEEVPRERTLADAELKALWHADDLVHRPLLRFLVLTGMRIGEAQAAQVEWIDADGWLHLPAEVMKNGKAHDVYLSTFARAQIEVDAQPHLFFSVTPTAVQAAVRRWQDRLAAKLEAKGKPAPAEVRWTPHDLRRTFATRLGDLGTAPHVVAKALGHTFTPSESLPTYLRSDWAQERKVAATALARVIERVVKR